MWDYADLFKSGTGAVIGFALAQVVNVAKIGWDHYRRPQLVISHPRSENWRVLSHETEVGNGDTLREEKFGFYVTNSGRRIATGVRFQLIKIEYRSEGGPTFAKVSEQTSDLAVYNESNDHGMESLTLVPGAKVLVHLASWREDYGVLVPATMTLPDYYEEICSGADEYRLTVVAFDDRARFAMATATISI